MSMKNICKLILCLMTFSAAFAVVGDETLSTITVSGEGRASAPPDMAIVQTGVTTRGDSASRALAENNTAMERVMDVLRQMGLQKKDIQTSGFKVQPEFDYKSRQQPPMILGYRVTNGIIVKMRDIEKVATLLDGLIQAGSNQISGIRFTFEDMSTLQDQARQKAYQDAHARAELYARAANVRLGKILRISEGPVQMPVSPGMHRLAAAESVAKVPIAVGENEIRATVNVVFTVVN